MSWSLGPNMNTKRGYFPCIVSPNNNLYAIGGARINHGPNENSIEWISTINIASNVWSYTANNMSEPLYGPGCVMYNEYIFRIGGQVEWENFSDKVHLINSITNEVSLLNHRLLYKLSGAASVIMNQKIFTFGGYNDPQFTTHGNISISDILSGQSTQPTTSPFYNPITVFPSPPPTTATTNINLHQQQLYQQQLFQQQLFQWLLKNQVFQQHL